MSKGKTLFLSLCLCCSNACVRAPLVASPRVRTRAWPVPEREEGCARYLCVKNKRMRSTRPETRAGSVRPQRLQIFPVSRGGRRGEDSRERWEYRNPGGRDGRTDWFNAQKHGDSHWIPHHPPYSVRKRRGDGWGRVNLKWWDPSVRLYNGELQWLRHQTAEPSSSGGEEEVKPRAVPCQTRPEGCPLANGQTDRAKIPQIQQAARVRRACDASEPRSETHRPEREGQNRISTCKKQHQALSDKKGR